MLLRLPQLRRVIPLRQWCSSHRALSDAVPKYSSKVRALPFAISQDDALQNMNYFANFTFISKDQSWRALWKALTGPTVVPKHIQAVYLPGWIVDAEVETKAWLGDSAQQLATVQLVDSYLPGYSFDFLSRISLNNDGIDASDTVPFSNDLITQHGSQVSCLPYSISPLSLVKKLRSQPKRVVVHDELRFDPAINLKFLAAYPILIPLYLAHYENESIGTTIVLEAFAPLGRVYFEFFQIEDWLSLRWASKLANHVHSNYWQAQGAATPFSRVYMQSWKHSGALHQWLDQMISQPGGAKQLISGSPIDFADNRVREFTEEETAKNRGFLNVSSEIVKMKDILKCFTDENSSITEIGLSGFSEVEGNDFPRIIKSEIDKLHQKRAGMMPEWWKGASKS